MITLNQIFKCPICGNIVEIVHVGGGTLVCCGKEMLLQVENSQDASQEKHVPVVEETADGLKIKVGEVAHPMEADHYIEWIEIMVGDNVARHFLKPGELPETEFNLKKSEGLIVRAYCNLHGLWVK